MTTENGILKEISITVNVRICAHALIASAVVFQ